MLASPTQMRPRPAGISHIGRIMNGTSIQFHNQVRLCSRNQVGLFWSAQVMPWPNVMPGWGQGADRYRCNEKESRENRENSRRHHMNNLSVGMPA